MTSTQNKYCCKYCSSSYKEKFNYDRHVDFCEFSFKSIKEIENEIEAFEKPPSVSQLFAFVKELSVRMNKLEKENAQLKIFVRQQKKRVNILDWLNNRYDCTPDDGFHEWMSSLPIEFYLEKIFETDLLTALIKCLDDGFENLEKIPICCFSQKLNVFYVYINDGKEDKKWSLITNKQLNKWFSFLSQKLLVAFKNWYDENKRVIDSNEKSKEQYYENFQKVLGGKMSDDTRNHRLRQYCYNKLKQNLKNIVEFEFV
jgi:hypothetical protein